MLWVVLKRLICQYAYLRINLDTYAILQFGVVDAYSVPFRQKGDSFSGFLAVSFEKRRRRGRKIDLLDRVHISINLEGRGRYLFQVTWSMT